MHIAKCTIRFKNITESAMIHKYLEIETHGHGVHCFPADLSTFHTSYSQPHQFLRFKAAPLLFRKQTGEVSLKNSYRLCP